MALCFFKLDLKFLHLMIPLDDRTSFIILTIFIVHANFIVTTTD